MRLVVTGFANHEEDELGEYCCAEVVAVDEHGAQEAVYSVVLRDLAGAEVVPDPPPSVDRGAVVAAARSGLRVPYPEFCRHPVRCSGRSFCPDDQCCCD